MTLRLLVVHQRGRIVRRQVDVATVIASHVATHENSGVIRPVALVMVEFERPLHLHLIRLHPVDFGVPAAVLRRTQRIDVAALRRIRILPLVLVKVVAAVVGG